jgi:hypothetical protein
MIRWLSIYLQWNSNLRIFKNICCHKMFQRRHCCLFCLSAWLISLNNKPLPTAVSYTEVARLVSTQVLVFLKLPATAGHYMNSRGTCRLHNIPFNREEHKIALSSATIRKCTVKSCPQIIFVSNLKQNFCKPKFIKFFLKFKLFYLLVTRLFSYLPNPSSSTVVLG